MRDRVINPSAHNQQILASEDEGDGGVEGGEVEQLLEGFSEKEKRRILRSEEGG